MQPFRAKGNHVVLNAGVLDIEAVRDAGLSDAMLHLTNAASLIADGHKQRVGRKRGGSKTARVLKAGAATWQNQCCAQFEALIRAGRCKRDIASLLAKRFGKHPATIRRALKKKASTR